MNPMAERREPPERVGRERRRPARNVDDGIDERREFIPRGRAHEPDFPASATLESNPGKRPFPGLNLSHERQSIRERSRFSQNVFSSSTQRALAGMNPNHHADRTHEPVRKKLPKLRPIGVSDHSHPASTLTSWKNHCEWTTAATIAS